MRGERFQFSCRNVPAVAIFIMRTDGGTHTGILHRNRGTLWVLDLLWHTRLRSSPCDRDYACVIPELELEEVNDITAMCRLIDQRHQERRATGGFRIPYAFRYHSSMGFSTVTGEYIPGDGIGLSCSTFVLKVFESVRIPLVNLERWPARPDDQARHVQLLQMMMEDEDVAPEHVQMVQAELPCIRVRPEEVAACAMANPLPAEFETAERGGRWVLEWITDDIQQGWI